MSYTSKRHRYTEKKPKKKYSLSQINKMALEILNEGEVLTDHKKFPFYFKNITKEGIIKLNELDVLRDDDYELGNEDNRYYLNSKKTLFHGVVYKSNLNSKYKIIITDGE